MTAPATSHRLARATLLLLLAWGIASPAAGHGAAHPDENDAKGSAIVAPKTESLSGAVEEIVIDDRAGTLIYRYRELRLDDGTALALRGAGVEALSAGDRIQVTGRRSGRTLDVETARSVVAARALARAAAPEDVEGTLAIVHSDDFAAGTGQFSYELHEDNGRSRRLDLATLPAVLRYGMRLRVNGHADADGQSLRPSRITILAPGPEEGNARRSAVDAKAATVNTVLVIMANFSNTAAPAWTATQTQQVMTSNAGSVANYYSEVSYGQQTLNVTTTSNWVTMNLAKPATCNTSDWQGIGTAAGNAAKAANSAWDPALYAFVVYVFPSVSACGWNGLAYIGFPHKAWINGTNSFVTQIIAHEMGHNFGLLHAASLRCTTAIGGACTVSEYGDPFDTMGNQRPMHFNARQKSKLNWIGASTVATHGSGTVTYALAPLETAGGALYAIKIPTASANRTYWVEFRQPIGFDAPLAAFPNNGAQVRVASPFETLCSGCDSYSDDTELLDMTPGTSTFTDAALVAGQTFSDTAYGVSISILAASSSSLTVQVSAGATQASSSTALAASPNPSGAGVSVTFTATVTGTAPTGSVNFTDGGTSIAGCAGVVLAGSGNVRTAACSTAALAAGTHTIVAAYGGDAGNAASGSGPLTQTVNAGGSTTGLASSANPSTQGSSVTFTATVSGVAPTGSVSFTDGASTLPGCGAVALGGSGNVRTAACTTNALTVASHSMAATYTGDAGNAGSASPILTQVVNGAASSNVALAANGGVASASSAYNAAYPVTAINDNERTGAAWGNGGGWNDATYQAYPDWVQIQFNGSKTIDRVVVYTLADNFAAGVEPTDTQTFSLAGIVDFNVQVWNGSAWVTVATVIGNNLVKRTVTFSPTTTSRIRVNVTKALDSYSRIIELEAWMSTSGASNVALATNGGVATASSTYSSAFPVTAVNDGDHTGATWESGGGWNDGTYDAVPDWVQIQFSGSKTVDRVVVYTLADVHGPGIDPPDGQTFTQAGIVDFTVEAWNGSSWTTLATITGNNLVKRTITFPATTTDRIRVRVTNCLLHYSRIVEIEAWGL